MSDGESSVRAHYAECTVYGSPEAVRRKVEELKTKDRLRATARERAMAAPETLRRIGDELGKVREYMQERLDRLEYDIASIRGALVEAEPRGEE